MYSWRIDSIMSVMKRDSLLVGYRHQPLTRRLNFPHNNNNLTLAKLPSTAANCLAPQTTQKGLSLHEQLVNINQKKFAHFCHPRLSAGQSPVSSTAASAAANKTMIPGCNDSNGQVMSNSPQAPRVMLGHDHSSIASVSKLQQLYRIAGWFSFISLMG